MASQGPLSPGTLADDSGVGSAAWSNPSNAASSNNVYATAALSTIDTISHYLKATNFGFSIPSGATILGIVVSIERKTDGSFIKDHRVRLVKGGVIQSHDKASATVWPTSDASVSYPSSGTTDLWDNTWTDVDINSSGFGAVLAVTMGFPGPETASVDHITITVYYQESSNININAPIFKQSATLKMGWPDRSWRPQPLKADVDLLNISTLPTFVLPIFQGDLRQFQPQFASAFSQTFPRLIGDLRVQVNAQFGTSVTTPLFKFDSRLLGTVADNRFEARFPTLKAQFDHKHVAGNFAIQVGTPIFKVDDRLKQLSAGIDTTVSSGLFREYLRGAMVVTAKVITHSNAHYIEPVRSSAAMVIMGTESGPFKLNKAGLAYRREGKSHVVHLFRAKPHVCYVTADFTLETAFANLAAGEFSFESHEQYLKLENTTDVTSALVADSPDFFGILIDVVQQSSEEPVITTFYQPRTPLDTP